MRRISLSIPDEVYWIGEKARLGLNQSRSEYYTAAMNWYVARHCDEVADAPTADGVGGKPEDLSSGQRPKR
jgi:hypothetical protein